MSATRSTMRSGTGGQRLDRWITTDTLTHLTIWAVPRTASRRCTSYKFTVGIYARPDIAHSDMLYSRPRIGNGARVSGLCGRYRCYGLASPEVDSNALPGFSMPLV